jgi:hypothetical protein
MGAHPLLIGNLTANKKRLVEGQPLRFIKPAQSNGEGVCKVAKPAQKVKRLISSAGWIAIEANELRGRPELTAWRGHLQQTY